MDDKNLDKLFQDKFKSFREVPDEKVWTGIERALDKKRKKRVIPLWWQLGGVAAILAIALMVFFPWDDTLNENPAVTDTEQKDARDSEETEVKRAEQNNVIIEEEDGSGNIHNGSQKGLISDKEKRDKGKKGQDPLTLEKSLQINPSKKEAVANRSKNASRLKDFENPSNPLRPSLPSSEKLVQKQTNERKKMSDSIKRPFQTSPNAQIVEGKPESLLDSDMEKAGLPSDESNKKSLFDSLEEQPEEELAETSRSRWSAGPSIAPVFFSAIGEGSPIDPGLAANGKSGNTNFSYGLSVAYAVTEKLSVRSGIHKIDYGYDTNNVAFTPTLNASAGSGLENIVRNGRPENSAISDVVAEPVSPNNSSLEFSNSLSTREGTVAQQFGYLEVPLELDYALVDGKFGVNLVGGVSSLFLINNSVDLNSGSLSTEIGEASNLNNLNFSTNLGFGVNYKFTPMIRLNIEPIFKYQLNTFSNTAGEFRPYSIGVYSGLNFRF